MPGETLKLRQDICIRINRHIWRMPNHTFGKYSSPLLFCRFDGQCCSCNSSNLERLKLTIFPTAQYTYSSGLWNRSV